MRLVKTAATALAGLGVWTIGAVATTSPAHAAFPTVHVWATNVNARTAPSLSATVVTRINPGNYAYICTARGSRVTDGPWTNIFWSKIDVDVDHDGFFETPAFVSDVYVSGGNNDQPAVTPAAFKAC